MKVDNCMRNVLREVVSTPGRVQLRCWHLPNNLTEEEVKQVCNTRPPDIDIDLPKIRFTRCAPYLYVGVSKPFERTYLIAPELGILRPATKDERELAYKKWDAGSNLELASTAVRLIGNRRMPDGTCLDPLELLSTLSLGVRYGSPGGRFVSVFFIDRFFVGVDSAEEDCYWEIEDEGWWESPVDDSDSLLERLSRIGLFARAIPIDL